MHSEKIRCVSSASAGSSVLSICQQESLSDLMRFSAFSKDTMCIECECWQQCAEYLSAGIVSHVNLSHINRISQWRRHRVHCSDCLEAVHSDLKLLRDCRRAAAERSGQCSWPLLFNDMVKRSLHTFWLSLCTVSLLFCLSNTTAHIILFISYDGFEVSTLQHAHCCLELLCL